MELHDHVDLLTDKYGAGREMSSTGVHENSMGEAQFSCPSLSGTRFELIVPYQNSSLKLFSSWKVTEAIGLHLFRLVHKRETTA
ncbi:hypothetical protein AVEN_198196-1 [Araneus ventricosus]|uniref:Uncharacterized protein n=1 Tax=Araneus ventricosus TaxID=182803 RepID=A0A4Y2E4B1_ARAVE|nr:hypothetical protein AVEN_198196-1 [Araneus ventricosus]